MSKWMEKPLGQLAKFQKGRKVATSEYQQGGYDAYLGASSLEGDVENYASTKLAVFADPGDVLMLWDGERSGLVGHNLAGVVSSTVSRITPGIEVTGTYLYYHLLSRFEWIQGRRTGTGVPHVPKDLAKILTVYYPADTAEQGQITDVLGSIDAAIKKTESLIAKYQQIKAGLMHDLFTRGVTAEGKLRPPREHAPELYKETPIGWIPKEWSVVCARQVVFPVTKGTTPTQMFATDAPSSVPFIRVQNLSFDGSLIFDEDTSFVSLSTHRIELSRSIVLPGDILMNIVGPPLGKISVVPNTYPEWNINQAIAIFRPREQKILDFLRHYLLSRFAQHWFLLRAKQTSGQVNITLEMCNALPIPWPIHDEERWAISDNLNAADRRIQSEQKLHSKLQKQKAGLMHDLLTGKVRVTTAA